MTSKSARSKHAARQQQPHASLESTANAPLRVYPPDMFRASAVAVSPLMQMLQAVNKPVPVVGILSTSYDSTERALAFANRIIGKYAFRDSDIASTSTPSATKDASATAAPPLLASVHLYYDASKPCAYLLGVARPENQCFERAARDADVAAFERERVKVQLLLHTCCNLLFVLHERARVSPTLLRDVRALAVEKQQLQAFASSSASFTGSSHSKGGAKKSSGGSASTSAFAPGRCVPLVLFVVPAPDAVLSATSSSSLSSAAAAGKTRSATVAYCKAYEAKLANLLRSLRGGLVGSMRMRDALTTANLSKDRRVFNLDPSHCAVVVSSRTASVQGCLDARLDDLLESLEMDVYERNGDAPDLSAMLAPLEDDDVGFPRAVQFLHRYVDLLLASASAIAPSASATGSASASSKDATVRVELLSLAHWLKAFHALVKTMRRMDTKRRQDAAASDAHGYQQQHVYNSADYAQ